MLSWFKQAPRGTSVSLRRAKGRTVAC